MSLMVGRTKRKRKAARGLSREEVSILKAELRKSCCSQYWLEAQFGTIRHEGPNGEETVIRYHDKTVYPPHADSPNCRMIRCQRCHVWMPALYVGIKRRVWMVDGYDAGIRRVGRVERFTDYHDGAAFECWVGTLCADGAVLAGAGVKVSGLDGAVAWLRLLGAEVFKQTVEGLCVDCRYALEQERLEAEIAREAENDPEAAKFLESLYRELYWRGSAWNEAMEGLWMRCNRYQRVRMAETLARQR